jgi:hypothetical protein
MLSSTAHDFIEACGESGCPACRLEQAYVKRYLDNLFYESVNDIDLRSGATWDSAQNMAGWPPPKSGLTGWDWRSSTRMCSSTSCAN